MRVAVCVLLLSSSLAAPARAHSIAERFAPRAYFTGQTRVPVSAWNDRVAVRAPGALLADIQQLSLEARTEKLRDAGIGPAAVQQLRKDGLFAVVLAHAVPRDVLVEYATLLSGGAGVLEVYPALSRMTGRAFYDEELVITARPGRLDEALAIAGSKVGAVLVRRSTLKDTALVRVGPQASLDAVEASAALHDVDAILSAEPNLVRELKLAATQDDPQLDDQWHLARTNPAIPGNGTVHADVAWDTTFGDPGVVVAVFDTGIDVDHVDLVDNMLEGFDAASDDDDPRPECTGDGSGGAGADCPADKPTLESHGTCVSGVIAARGDNGIGVSGVCPRCSILPVRLLGDSAGTGLSIAESFARAVDLGADVINNSWGPGSSLYFPLSQSERDAFDAARDEGRDGLGTVILFAAGNSTADVAGDPYASHPYVLAIAASTNVDDWAVYSNYGAAIDVAAPSQGLPESQDGYPDDDFGILTTDVTGNDGYSGNDYAPDFSGTSAASPVAAGVVGLVLSVNPTLTAQQVRLVLTRSAEKIVADKLPWLDILGEDIEAVFAYDETGHSIGFGYGRVDAGAAVALANDPGLDGALCSATGCATCSQDGRCLSSCASQDDCVDGTVCDVTLGVCQLPRAPHDAFREPCNADCAYCAPTLDTEFATTSICTVTCEGDADCPDAFDCRLTELDGESICVPGSASAGDSNDFFNCYAPLVGGPMFARTEEGRELCVDVCFADTPGSCPWGFTCHAADCDCSTTDCNALLCTADDNEAPDNNDFPFAVCMPLPGHADLCAQDVDCQGGDYCGPDGKCRLDDRAGCDVCGTCSSDDDCAGRGRCFGLRDDGIGECIWFCADADPCPGDSVCRPIDFFGGSTALACVSPEGGSTADDRCDPAYQCAVECRDDVACGGGKVCDGGACVSAPPDDAEDDSRITVQGGGCLGCSSAGAMMPMMLSLLALLRRRRRFLPAWVFAAVLLPLIAACGGGEGEGEGEEGEGETDPGTAAYKANCQICHGEDGGEGTQAPQIANPVVDYATYVVRNGHAVMGFAQEMPAFPEVDLSNEDLALILDFLSAQPKPADGQGLYQRFCLNCHGDDGASGRVNAGIAGTVGSEVQSIARNGHRATDVTDFEYMPAFSAELITDEELALIATYVTDEL